jgi:hypothetical protein
MAVGANNKKNNVPAGTNNTKGLNYADRKNKQRKI